MSNKRKKFGKIYDEKIDKIYRFVFLKVNSKEKAEDITSETFSKAWSVFKNDNQEIRNVNAFLYRIAKNLVIDHYRANDRYDVVPADDIPIVDNDQDIEQEAFVNSDMRKVRTALAELNDDYQNAIIWYYLDELHVSKVAELLGRTESATRVLIHRALYSLKDKIQKS
jgi:RNA polymerase sigma-70 factor (ECF subfamily)